MTHIARPTFSRRGFVGSVSGLLLSCAMPAARAAEMRGAGGDFMAYLHIAPDNTIAIQVGGIEMGQGIITSLPKILCEELDADFALVTTSLAPADMAFANPNKKRQTTGNSDAIPGYAPLMRKIGAQAKAMLIAAAAKQWNVAPATCRAENSVVFHDASKRSATYGALAAAAAKMPVPEAPTLKSPDQFKLIGKPTLRKDTPAKVDGSVMFGTDVILPGLLHATVRTCPVFGGTVKSYDTAAKFPGVQKLVELTDAQGNFNGIGVIADGFWPAKKAAEALNIAWDTKGNERYATGEMTRAMLTSLDNDAAALPLTFGNGKVGDVPGAMKTAAKTWSAVYEVPYLAHACMEPMAATCVVETNRVEMWAPAQQQGEARQLAATLTGVPFENVRMNTMLAGGGFGRKWELDFIRQVVLLAKAMPGRPVRMMWTREEDIQHDCYRPGYAARVAAALDKDGAITAMHARLSGQSLFTYQKRSPKPPMIDPTAVGGAISAAYGIPNTLIDYVEAKAHMPVGFWRSVGASYTGFFSESAIDELAVAAGKDPLAYRRMLVKDNARAVKVLDAVAEMSGWGRTLAPGQGLGVSFTPGFDALVAQVVQVSVAKGELKVEKVWCVYDAGFIVEPTTVVAQMEGGIIFGLSAALFGEITVENGAVKQGNFIDYGMVTLATAPEIAVKVIESDAKPGGAGEASVPGIAPALANAIYAATGNRIRKLPFRNAGLTMT